ncbi:MAG: TerB family tellurite resistance protein [Thermoanaerobaculia bacterium]|nr:TerB family tellurite resistance protein [Thermoanaerobaculia bacterium]
MSILKNLFGLTGPTTQPEESDGDTETVRRIVGELEALDAETARYLAAFAYILSRVANADLDVSVDETRAMERIVHDLGHLPEDQAILVVQIAKSQNKLLGGTENYLVTREFKEIATPEQRRELLDCLFAVSAADGSISVAEEETIRRIASELGFGHKEYIEARQRYSEYRDVLKGM